MRESFTQKRFNTANLLVIEQANDILTEYADKGYTMTLRQLHYQFVSRDLYSNTQQNYKRLGNIMSEARLAGLVDWSHMEDRVRELDKSPRWGSPTEIIDAVASQYREDLWHGQTFRPEVWIEKDALAGVIEGICRELRIDFFACRGYVSQSAQYDAAQRFMRYRRNGQEPIVYHFGDHDPSGLDMTRENAAKFKLLTGQTVRVRRLALNYDQVLQYNPPPNFAKVTDSRAENYIREFGDKSWELDALDPEVLTALIRETIEPIIDRPKWQRAEKAERKSRSDLNKVALNWSDIVKGLS